MKYLTLTFSLLLLFQLGRAQPSLEEVFRNPPPEARPWGYWIWSHGNFDYATMDRELKAFQEMGLGGVDIFDIGVRDRLDVIPPGPAFMSTEQVDGMAYALNKAQELGLGMGLIVSSSWNAGGSWTKPEDQIKNLVVWQDTLEGPVTLDRFPFPEVPTEFVKPYATLKLYPELDSEGKPQYYQNVALMAYPLSGEGVIADTASLKFFDKDLPESNGGSLELPEGKWVVSRAIETNYGQKLFVPSDSSDGYTIDHFSKQATQRHFNYIIERLQARLGDLSKTALQRFYLASYEATATIMWTTGLPEIFREQNGYRLEPFLPALMGTTVIDEKTTERFLYDYRKTISELFIEGHYREARRISNQHGLKIASESGGPGPPLHNVPTEDLKALGSVDIMRGEFWNREPIHRHENGLDVLQVVKNIGSAAHIYGRKIVEMESFTSMQHWQEGPMILKKLADQAFCEGMTRVVYHTMPHSPPEAGLPGWSYSAGTHIHPNMTWWEMSKPFHRYLTTVSGMLMQGNFVADVAYYYGSSIPNFALPKHVRPGLGFGYDYDDLNTEVLLTADVRDGRVVLPSGMEYPLLVLPDDKRMELAVLEKIAELLKKGATVLGPKPSRVYGLTNYREQEAKLNQLANEIWGSGKAKKVNRKYGAGRIVSGATAREVLSDLGIFPDFQYQWSSSGEGLDYIHRRSDSGDIYFIRNTDSVAVQVEASFRVTGKQPEFWDATDLSMKKVGIFQEKEERTYLPITLPAWGSMMVVFQDDLTGNDRYITQVVQGEEKLFPRTEERESYRPFMATREGDNPWSFQAAQPGDYQLQWSDGTTEEITIDELQTIPWEGPWDVRFPLGWGVEPLQTFEELVSWTEAEEPDMKYFSGTATYRNQLEITPEQLSGQPQVWLDLGEVREAANVYLNGVQVNRSCFAPYRYEVTDVLRPGKNFLVVEVANTWENRMKGDVHAAPEDAFTNTNVTSGNSWADRPWKDKPLQLSGLLGPVRIILQPTVKLSTP
jgi:hypothetical protein